MARDQEWQVEVGAVLLPSQDALHKRRARLAETIEWQQRTSRDRAEAGRRCRNLELRREAYRTALEAHKPAERLSWEITLKSGGDLLQRDALSEPFE